MRRVVLSALMTALLLLPRPAAREEKLKTEFDTFRQAVTVASEIRLQAELTADYGDTAASYTVAASSDGRETTVEILAPELIAGVKATVEQGEVTASYENVVLGAGALDEEGLTPVSAIPAMLDAMASGYIELLWREGDYLTARLYVGEESVLTLWLDGETLAPVSGEISSGGQTVVSCKFMEWVVT